MPSRGISNFADSDMEDNSNFIDENSVMTINNPSASPEPPKKKGGRSKATANKVTKAKSTATRKVAADTGAGPKRAKKTSAPKRKALEEQINGKNAEEEKDQAAKGPSTDGADVIMSEALASEDELESPKTMAQEKQPGPSKTKPVAASKGASKQKASARTRPKQEEIDQNDQSRQFASTIPDSQNDARAASNPFKSVPSLDVEVFRRAPTDFRRDDAFRDRSMRDENPYRPGFIRGDNPFENSYRDRQAREDNSFRRRAGSASDSERHGGDPQLRRRLGDMTRKFENVDLKYRTLRELGIMEANSNVEKLKKQCEATTAASDKIVASLKKELVEEKTAAQEHRRAQKSIQTLETENSKLVANVTELTANLSAAQNEIKALQAKLAASRTAATTVESTNGRVPGSAMKHNVPTRTVLVGSAEAAQAAQIAQMKEDLYSDLTGLIVRGVKRIGDEDTFDCIQTGRNGTLHFKLTIANEENGKATSFEDTEFLYTPLLDSNRDRDLLELLPDYLTEEITFSRQHAAKFYSRVVETLTKRRNED